MPDQATLQRLFQQRGCSDFRWIDPAEIVVAQWVRMKCTFGCESYGRNAACPPNTPSVEDCRALLREYRIGTMFRFPVPAREREERADWTRQANMVLLKLEQEVISSGFPKAFLLFLDCCTICKDCAKQRSSCRNRKLARPSPEGMAIDVLATAGRFEFLDNSQGPRSYAFLLLE